MSINVTDDTMASTTLPVSARFSPDAAADGKGAWVVSWIPGRLFDRNQAITAMVLAQHVAEGHGRDPFTGAWAAELHLSVAEVVRYLEAAQADQIAATGGA